MAAPVSALTHHAIVALIEPFTRAGHRLDLAACDRMRRHLAFCPVEHAAAGAMPALVERLRLDCAAGSRYRLTRTLSTGEGTVATLEFDGTSPGALLHALDGVGSARQFLIGEGYVAARHDRAFVLAGDRTPSLHPVGANLRVGTLAMEFDFPNAPGIAARLRVSQAAMDQRLPDDVLAVLGWDWSWLRDRDGARHGTVRLRGRDLDPAANHVVRTAAAHLVRACAEGPQRFCTRMAPHRTRAALRRSIPWIAFALMALEATFVDVVRAAGSPWSVIVAAAPLGLLGLYFSRSQDLRFEWPRWPR